MRDWIDRIGIVAVGMFLTGCGADVTKPEWDVFTEEHENPEYRQQLLPGAVPDEVVHLYQEGENTVADTYHLDGQLLGSRQIGLNDDLPDLFNQDTATGYRLNAVPGGVSVARFNSEFAVEWHRELDDLLAEGVTPEDVSLVFSDNDQYLMLRADDVVVLLDTAGDTVSMGSLGNLLPECQLKSLVMVSDQGTMAFSCRGAPTSLLVVNADLSPVISTHYDAYTVYSDDMAMDAGSVYVYVPPMAEAYDQASGALLWSVNLAETRSGEIHLGDDAVYLGYINSTTGKPGVTQLNLAGEAQWTYQAEHKAYRFKKLLVQGDTIALGYTQTISDTEFPSGDSYQKFYSNTRALRTQMLDTEGVPGKEIVSTTYTHRRVTLGGIGNPEVTKEGILYHLGLQIRGERVVALGKGIAKGYVQSNQYPPYKTRLAGF